MLSLTMEMMMMNALHGHGHGHGPYSILMSWPCEFLLGVADTFFLSCV